jgi:rSAM/selenodomain-associated transferase 2
MTISIIIPTYNEAGNIAKLVKHLKANSNASVIEIIVTDGGSTDNTIEIAASEGATAMVSPNKGRAAQMNYGVSLAKGEVLYFIHADTLPPKNFATDILNAIASGYDFGRYKTRFLSRNPILRINEWFTRFDLFICYGGDQTLFIKKDLFNELDGFKPDMLIMEEYEFCKRAKEKGKYIIMKDSALISARKYEKNSWVKVQLANYKVVNMYKKGATQQSMVEQYKKMLKF